LTRPYASTVSSTTQCGTALCQTGCCCCCCCCCCTAGQIALKGACLLPYLFSLWFA
jgi:hypothetical protein